MRRLLEELKNFLSNATPEQLEQAWKEVEQFKDVGPTVKDFCEQYKKVGKSEWFKKMYNGKSIGDILIVEGTDPNIKGYEELQKEDKDFQKGYAEALNDTAKWLEKNLLNYWQQSITDPSEFIDRFRKEMKEQL